MAIVKWNPMLHYNKYRKWCEARSFPPLPRAALPATGFIVNDAALGFLYTTDSTFGLMEWLTTNPEKSSTERHEALNTLIDVISNTARDMGIVTLFSSINDEGLIKRYQEKGFILTDRGMTNFIKGVGV